MSHKASQVWRQEIAAHGSIITAPTRQSNIGKHRTLTNGDRENLIMKGTAAAGANQTPNM